MKTAVINSVGGVESVAQFPTPLWRGLHSLKDALSSAHGCINHNAVRHAVTMTAELADIFTDRDSGVKAVVELLDSHFDGRAYRLYARRKGLVEAGMAAACSADIASANWHATACFTARRIKQGILIDIGSTTTDIIPFAAGKLLNIADTDYERLRSGELVYTGIVRTPVMGVTGKIFFAGKWQNIAAENFSTMADVYRLTGELDERDDMMAAADRLAKTRHGSARRLARMIGLDLGAAEDISALVEMAQGLAGLQLSMIEAALLTILRRPASSRIDCLVGTGAGHFLARKLALKNSMDYIDFGDLFNCDESEKHGVRCCAPAIAVAQIDRGLNCPAD